MIIRVYLLFLVVIFCSCHENNKINADFKVIDIYPDLTISEIGDSIFLSNQCDNIFISDNMLYAMDKDNEKILIFDFELGLKDIIPIQKGKGPGQFIYPGMAMVNNEELLEIVDVSTGIISIIDKSSKELVDKFKIPFPGGFEYKYISDGKGNYIVSSGFYDKPIIKYNRNNNTTSKFGYKHDPDLDIERQVSSNLRFLFLNEEKNLVSVLVEKPIIEVYSLQEEKLIHQVQLDHIYPEWEKKYIEAREKNPKISIRMFIDDSDYKNDHLYLLEATTAINGLDNGNILVLKENFDGSFIPMKRLQLNGGNYPNLYTSIAVTDNFIFAINKTNNQIERYSLR